MGTENEMGEKMGGCMSGGGEVKRNGWRYVGGGKKKKKKERKKKKKKCGTVGGEKKKKKKKKRSGERGRIYNGNRGRGRR
jgi:hypothetical protein